MRRLLIVEDHASMRESLAGVFDEKNGYKIVGETSDAAKAASLCARLKPDLVLMDVCTDGGASGLKALEEIRGENADVKIILMTAFDEISYVPRAKELKADGFIYKTSTFKEFLEAADKVFSGKKVFPEVKSIPVPMGEMPLTEREIELLRLMCDGKSTKEITKELHITENTLKYHKRNMIQKTGHESIMALVVDVMANGWINPKY